jgi:hypothetical protein
VSLELRFPGEMQVVRGGEPAELPPSKKTRGLLAYLVLTGRPHRRERLCQLLWDVADDPRGALRWSLSRLRALVDEPERPRIWAPRDSVAFDAQGARVDILALKQRCVDGLAGASLAELTELASQFRGELLEGLDLDDFLDFQAWCVAEREETRKLHAAVLRAGRSSGARRANPRPRCPTRERWRRSTPSTSRPAMRGVRADLVIGADGLRSSVAALVDAPVTRRGRHAAGTVYGYWSGLELDGYHWHWGRGASAGAIPTNGGQVLLFASASARRFADEMRADVPARRLPRARLLGSLHGFPGHTGRLRRPWGPGWALVGDAGYFKDPITAHGLSDALRDAELLASAAAEGSESALAAYEAARDELSIRLFEVTDRIASMAWDTAELKELHQALSDEMKREVAALAGRPAAETVLARMA